MCLNFLRTAILNCYDVIWLLLLLIINVLLYTTMEQPYYVIKIEKWRRLGNLKAKPPDIHIHIFGTLKLSLHFLER